MRRQNINNWRRSISTGTIDRQSTQYLHRFWCRARVFPDDQNSNDEQLCDQRADWGRGHCGSGLSKRLVGMSMRLRDERVVRRNSWGSWGEKLLLSHNKRAICACPLVKLPASSFESADTRETSGAGMSSDRQHWSPYPTTGPLLRCPL